MVNISWNDAAILQLAKRTGRITLAYENAGGLMQPVLPINTGYRLPTEAEWVFAARYAAGPNPTRFPWGDTMPPVEVAANYADEHANMVPYHIEGYTDHYRGPSPVKTYPANEFGIYDLPVTSLNGFTTSTLYRSQGACSQIRPDQIGVTIT